MQRLRDKTLRTNCKLLLTWFSVIPCVDDGYCVYTDSFFFLMAHSRDDNADAAAREELLKASSVFQWNNRPPSQRVSTGPSAKKESKFDSVDEFKVQRFFFSCEMNDDDDL